MSVSSSISFASFDGFLLIACSGRGNFLNSPVLRKVGDEGIAAGSMLIVIDLSGCTGMDSTFMGTLAGIGRRLSSLGGQLQIADPGEKCRGQLESMGLDNLLEIEPPVAIWRGKMEACRLQLLPVDEDGVVLKGLEQAQHVLNAHIVLSDISESNAEKFKGVVNILSEEVKDKSIKDKE